MKKNDKQVIAYIRDSIHGEKKVSPETQKAKCKKYCELHLEGYRITYLEDLDFSGGNTKRDSYQEMIRQIEAGLVKAIVVYKVDRVSRSVKDFIDFWDVLNKYNVEFSSVTEKFDTTTPTGRAMLKLLIIFAELEREITAERIKHSNQQRALKGVQLGNPPLGYKRTKRGSNRWKVVEKEAKIVRKIFKMYATGEYSYDAIARELNDFGYKSKTRTKRKGIYIKDENKFALGGNIFSGPTIKNILTNPVYTGEETTYLRRTKRVKRKNNDEVKELMIIDQTTFEKCQKIRESRIPKRKQTRRLTERKEYPLRNSVYCFCGGKMRPRYRSSIHRLTFECRDVRHPRVKTKGKIINPEMVYGSVVWYDQIKYETVKYLKQANISKEVKNKALLKFREKATNQEKDDLKTEKRIREQIKRVHESYIDLVINKRERDERIKKLEKQLSTTQKPENHILTEGKIKIIEQGIKSVDLDGLFSHSEKMADDLIKLMVKEVRWDKVCIKKIELFPEFQFFYNKPYQATSKQLRNVDMAKVLGIKQEMLRYYNNKGYLPALPISSSNFKLYDSMETKKRFGLIKSVTKGSWNGNEIREVLAKNGYK